MRFSGASLLVLGLALLALNLTMRHAPLLHDDLLIFLTGWIGSILIVVGVGSIVFLEEH